VLRTVRAGFSGGQYTVAALHQTVPKHAMKSLLSLILVLSTAGCATISSTDPFEPVNRAMFKVNEKLDSAILEPVARGYVKAVPEPVRYCASNIFSNLGDVWTGINNFLQGKGDSSVNDFGRFALNTTAGVLGCFDIASKLEVPKHYEDLGQTLGVWGLGPGPYIVLPLLGPSTLRDLAGRSLETFRDPIRAIPDVSARNTAIVLRGVDRRAELLDAGELLEGAALDKYSFTRDAYLQRRRSLIFDGDPPDDDPPPRPQSQPQPEAEPSPQTQPKTETQPQAAPQPRSAAEPELRLALETRLRALSESATAPLRTAQLKQDVAAPAGVSAARASE
jgi:phospholipid-binding lipoprotein MlaA